MKKVILLALLLLVSACKKEKYLVLNDLKIDVNQKVNSCDFIDSINGKDVNAYLKNNPNFKKYCFELDTSKIGFINISFGDKKEYTVEVVDEIAPDIKTNDIIYEIDDQNNFSFDKYYKVIDNYDPYPFINIKGEYDLFSEGEYILDIIAVDSSKNRSKKSFKLKVTEKKKYTDVVVVDKQENITSLNHQKDNNDNDNLILNDVMDNSIKGVKDVYIKKESEINELIFLLTNSIEYHKAYQVEFESVNLSVVGNYTVNYKENGVLLASCNVFVVED